MTRLLAQPPIWKPIRWEIGRVPLDDRGALFDVPRQPGVVGDVPAAPSDRDSTVGGGSHVVHLRPAVRYALAAGPADLLQHVGYRLRQDDVARGHREAAA